MIQREPSDDELIELIREDSKNLKLVYNKCKSYCIRFMNKKATGSRISEEEIADIYHDAIIVLYEKIISGKFILTASIQTYINSVCFNMLMNRFKIIYRKDNYDEDINLQFDPNIKDDLEALDEKENHEKLYLCLEKSLETIKSRGTNCYLLITLFWYHKKSISELTQKLGYTNDVNTRNQKYKCQKRLKVLSEKCIAEL